MTLWPYVITKAAPTRSCFLLRVSLPRGRIFLGGHPLYLYADDLVKCEILYENVLELGVAVCIKSM